MVKRCTTSRIVRTKVRAWGHQTINRRPSRRFFIDGQSPQLLACTSRRASTICQPREFRYLQPVNGLRNFPWSAVPSLILVWLVLDVFLYFLCILSDCIHIVFSALELLISILVLPFQVFLVYHQTALSFQVSHETGHGYVWRIFQQHMYMVYADFCFYNLDLFPHAQRS